MLSLSLRPSAPHITVAISSRSFHILFRAFDRTCARLLIIIKCAPDFSCIRSIIILYYICYIESFAFARNCHFCSTTPRAHSLTCNCCMREMTLSEMTRKEKAIFHFILCIHCDNARGFKQIS